MRNKINFIITGILILGIFTTILIINIDKKDNGDLVCYKVVNYPNGEKSYHYGNIYEELKEYENSLEFEGYKWKPDNIICEVILNGNI